MKIVKCEYKRCNQIAKYRFVWYNYSNEGVKIKTKNSCDSGAHLSHLLKTYKTAPDELLNIQTNKSLPNKLEEMLQKWQSS